MVFFLDNTSEETANLVSLVGEKLRTLVTEEADFVEKNLSEEEVQSLESLILKHLGLEETHNAIKIVLLSTFAIWFSTSQQSELDPVGLTVPLWEVFYNRIQTFRSESQLALAQDILEFLSAFPRKDILNKVLSEMVGLARNLAQFTSLAGQDLVGRVFHRILSGSLAKAFATYYTKPESASFLASLVITKGRESVVDFACGTGTLLVATYHQKRRVIQGLGDHSASPRLVEEITGYEAMETSVKLAQLNLMTQDVAMADLHESIHHVPCNRGYIGSLEFLLPPMPKSLISFVVNSNEEHYPKAPRHKFDVVVMNPPFTRSDNIPSVLGEGNDRLIRFLQKNQWSSYYRAGLASLFVLLGSRFLVRDGQLALVLPTSVLSSGSWKVVREWLDHDYSLNYLCVSWSPQSSAFSENTKLREVLLVFCRRMNNKNPTVVVHLDRELTDLAEATQLGEVVRSRTSETLTNLSDIEKNLSLGTTTYGSTLTIHPSLVHEYTSNWYRFVAFRTLALVQTVLFLLGRKELPSLLPEIPLTSVRKLFNVSGAIDHTKGLELTDRSFEDEGEVSPDSLLGLWGSSAKDQNQLELDPNKVVRRKRGGMKLEGKVGKIFLPRKGRLNTRSLLAIKTTRPAVSNVWFPLSPLSDLRGKAGYKPTLEEVAKATVLFVNSTVGWLMVLAERQEILGAMVYFNKVVVVDLPVLDLTSLSKIDFHKLGDLFDRLKVQPIGTFLNQLEKAISYLSDGNSQEPQPFRLELDLGLMSIISAISVRNEAMLEFYQLLHHDFQLLSTLK